MQDAIAIDDIDGDFIPRPRRDVVELEAGSERVLIRGMPYTAQPHRPLVWQCFDGDVSLNELIGELADATSTKEETIRSDVMELTRNLASIGMLEDIASPEPEPETEPERLQDPWIDPRVEVGEPLPTFVLPDLDGDETSWDSFRGRPALLVNWSTTCGFCTQIAGELAALQGSLRERDVSLVFLARGSAGTEPRGLRGSPYRRNRPSDRRQRPICGIRYARRLLCRWRWKCRFAVRPRRVRSPSPGPGGRRRGKGDGG